MGASLLFVYHLAQTRAAVVAYQVNNVCVVPKLRLLDSTTTLPTSVDKPWCRGAHCLCLALSSAWLPALQPCPLGAPTICLKSGHYSKPDLAGTLFLCRDWSPSLSGTASCYRSTSGAVLLEQYFSFIECHRTNTSLAYPLLYFKVRLIPIWLKTF